MLTKVMVANFTNSYMLCQRKLNIMRSTENNFDKRCISGLELFN